MVHENTFILLQNIVYSVGILRGNSRSSSRTIPPRHSFNTTTKVVHNEKRRRTRTRIRACFSFTCRHSADRQFTIHIVGLLFVFSCFLFILRQFWLTKFFLFSPQLHDDFILFCYPRTLVMIETFLRRHPKCKETLTTVARLHKYNIQHT